MGIYHISYSLNSLQGVLQGKMGVITIGLIQGDTRSLDNGTYRV